MADALWSCNLFRGGMSAACTVLLLLSGCFPSTAPTEAEPLPFTGMQIELLVPDGLGLKAAMHATLEEWSAQSGAACRVSEFAVSTDAATDIRAVQATDGQLIVFPLTHVADYAAAGLLQTIPQSQLSTNILNWADLFAGLRHSVAMQGENPTVLPLSCPTLVCYYRRDLLEAADLAPPETWKDYEQLLETQQDWTGGLPVVEPWATECVPTMFLAHTAAFAKHPDNYSLLFDVSTGEPLVNRPGFVNGLKSMQRVARHLGTECLQTSLAEGRQLILSGKAAMTFAYETSRASRSLPSRPERNRSESAATDAPLERGPSVALGFCRLPGTRQVFDVSDESWKTLNGDRVNHVAVVGWEGLGIAIRAGCSEREQLALCQLLRRLTIEQVQLALPDGARSLCRHSQMRSAVGWVGKSLEPQERAEFVRVTADSLKSAAVVADCCWVGRHRFRASLAAAIHRAIRDQAPSQAVLDQLAIEWESEVQQIGRRKFLDSYRAGLGLRPSI
ncbi:MAG: extracellular solute-binding protein [Planctomycetaceae bacterium]